MTRAEILGIILGIISIILAIPGFLIVFFTEELGYGILALLLAIVVLGVAIFIYIRDRQPPFTIITVKNVLTMDDAQGKLAKYWGTRTIRANQNAQVEYWIGGITSDGSVDNILIGGRAPDAIRHAGGEIIVCKRYAPPLNRGDVVKDLELTMDYVDSYMNSDGEVYSYRVAYETREFNVTIHFDPSKPCKDVWAYMTHWGTMLTTPVAQPVPTNNDTRVDLQVKKPRVGATYTIEWRW